MSNSRRIADVAIVLLIAIDLWLTVVLIRQREVAAERSSMGSLPPLIAVNEPSQGNPASMPATSVVVETFSGATTKPSDFSGATSSLLAKIYKPGTQPVFVLPASDAEKWDFGSPVTSWSDWYRLTKKSSYENEAPFNASSRTSASGPSGRPLNGK
jgi:hypothetical protein